MFVNETKSNNTQDSFEAFLTNGERKIFLSQVTSSKKDGKATSSPALGYELIENGGSLAALQYYGGGLLGQNKNIIWLHNNLNEKMKITLAAAMTAILQNKN